jgi:aerobic-type carbon monoxide dehydrogenase small subunit (CoxS/CutS family)
VRFEITVNGTRRALDVPANTALLWALRDDLGLTGTRFGCGMGQCGACFVIAGGKERASCLLTVETVAREGLEVTTVEGLASGARLHPVQQAFIDEDAMQCGYCTSGMLIGAAALLAAVPRPDEATVRERLANHLCRCGVYGRVVRAIQRASAAT